MWQNPFTLRNLIQGVLLTITVQSSGAQRLFDHLVYNNIKEHKFMCILSEDLLVVDGMSLDPYTRVA